MKKVKVLGISFLAISLCVPLLGFKYVATETSTEANSLLNSNEFQTSSSLDAFESTEISSSSTVVGNETSGSSTTSTSDQGNTITTESNEDQNTVRLVPTDEKFYISITDKNYELLDKPDGTIIEDKKQQYQKTFSAQTVIGESGTEYYELSNLADHVVGYIRPISAEVVEGNQGKFYSENNVFASIDSPNVDLLNEQFQKQGTTEKIMNQTFKIDGYYNHFDGTTYYLLSDINNKKIGLVKSIALKISENPFGKANIVNDYYTVIKDDQKIWTNLEFTEVGTTEKIMNQTFNVKEWYYHLDGKKYYALYDNSANFKGFVEENTIKKATSRGGVWHGTNEYVTVTKNYYQTYTDFNFNVKGNTKNMMNKTYHLQGWYHHVNGNKYYSLYDNNNKWQGYVNEAAVTKSNGRQGTGFSTNKSVLVIKNGYSIWNNFNWNEKTRTNSLINKTYQVKWYYKHMNGSTYYSLYEANGKWFGYVNSDAVRERKGAASYLGTTRQRVVNELSAHQNDRFYFGTPYRGLSSSNPEPFLSPYGAPNAYGPGMNCTGFVACVMRRSGGNLNRISGITQGWGSYANAYNWRDALMRNTEYYTFNSVDALLKSGKAQKGDIIYFDPVWTDINYDCHIGIFWGNSSTENKIWHQVLAGNMTSNIFSGTRFSKIYLFPQD